MGKVVTTVLIIVAVIVLVAVAQPHLALLLGSIGLHVAAAQAIAAVVIGLAAGVISQLIMGKPKALSQSLFDRLNLTVDPTAPRKIVFGQTAAGADVRYHETYSSPIVVDYTFLGEATMHIPAKANFLWQVVALASHKINSVQTITLDDTLSYTGGALTGTFNSQSALYLAPVLEGTATNGHAIASGTYWKSTATFTGCAYLVIAMKDDATVYTSGIPTRITTVVEGCPVYDPRLDSTNGGSGAMRPDDQTTWAYYNGSDDIGRNSALCLLTYLLGWKINGIQAWGMGVPASRIDLTNFITYANVCDESVTTSDSSTVKRYQCDGIFSTADTHQSIIDAIDASMGTAQLVDTGGQYSIVGGYDDLSSPIAEFGADDLVGQYQWKPAPASKDRHTTINGRFADPTQLYQLNQYPQVTTDALADGIYRPLAVDFNCVSRSESCQRIAKQMLAREAFPGVFTSTFGPSAFAVQVGSLVHLTLPQEGWNQKLFRVIDQAETIDLLFQMTLTEESSVIYEWDSSEAVDLPPVIRPPAYDPLAVEGVASLAATARTITNSTGGKDSYIDVTWAEPTTTPATIEIQARETGGTLWTTATDRTDAHALAFTFRAVSSGLSTDIQARFRMQSGAYGSWSSLTVTAAVGSGANSVVGYLTNESMTFAADASGNIL